MVVVIVASKFKWAEASYGTCNINVVKSHCLLLNVTSMHLDVEQMIRVLAEFYTKRQ